MAEKTNLKVHLDHLIPRESLRYLGNPLGSSDPNRSPLPYSNTFKYSDLQDQATGLFALLRKPDFQRETSAWSPEACVSLLESIVGRLIIPSIIMWASPENGLVYILDGGHRVSVVRAWMLDDWGDKAPGDYYGQHEYAEEIREAAIVVRDLVKAQIGNFQDFVNAGKRFLDVAQAGRSTREELSSTEFRRGDFYAEMLKGIGFHIQWVPGNYNVAEASFLKINRTGQPLEEWETTLIENRNSSFARAVMSVANGGTGRYWPDEVGTGFIQAQIKEIRESSEQLHRKLFVPPLKTPINDLNVPFIAVTRFFPKHPYLLELFPIILGKNGTDEEIASVFKRDKDADPETITRNGRDLILRAIGVFQHLTGSSEDPLSLSIVPLFYFYTKAGRYVRSSLYGFIPWLMSGNDDDIRARKVIFSAHRGRFEQVIFDQDMPGALTRRLGSGAKATYGTAEFYQRLLELLVEDPSPVVEDSFQSKLKVILEKLTAPRLGKMAKEGRRFDDTQKTTINMREIFKNAIRCEICDGVLDLRAGTQYDHVLQYAQTRVTDVRSGRPTHPFCNNQREAIEAYINGTNRLNLPPVVRREFIPEDETVQLSLFSLFEKTAFPGE